MARLVAVRLSSLVRTLSSHQSAVAPQADLAPTKGPSPFCAFSPLEGPTHQRWAKQPAVKVSSGGPPGGPAHLPGSF